jgi:hypothetical protein
VRAGTVPPVSSVVASMARETRVRVRAVTVLVQVPRGS